jgi:hypothetical protein
MVQCRALDVPRIAACRQTCGNHSKRVELTCFANAMIAEPVAGGFLTANTHVDDLPVLGQDIDAPSFGIAGAS